MYVYEQVFCVRLCVCPRLSACVAMIYIVHVAPRAIPAMTYALAP